MGANSDRCLRCSLHARVVAATSTCPGSLWLLTALSFLRRTDSCCLCTLLTARRICRMAADRSHDSTFSVDDGRTTTTLLGAHHSTSPLGRSYAALADSPVPLPGGFSEHGTLSVPSVLRPRGLSD